MRGSPAAWKESRAEDAPRIRFWDIETAALHLRAYQRNVNGWIPSSAIKRDSWMLSACWKDLGDDTMHSATHKAPQNDKALTKQVRGAVLDCDVLVHHNGNKFDLPFLSGRLAFHKLPPLPQIRTVDTLKIARRHLRLPAYDLDYLGQFFDVGRKVVKERGLEERMEEGDPGAVRAFIEYNEQDVLLLERVYLRLLPFCKGNDHPNLNLVLGTMHHCPRCGSLDTVPERATNGETRKHRTQVRSYPQYRCKTCQATFRGDMTGGIYR